MRFILINNQAMYDNAAPSGSDPVPLSSLGKGAGGLVTEVLEADGGVVGDDTGATIGRRLVELGFVAGERVRVIEAVWPGGDPIAVRVGSTVFALRRREARAVLVQVDGP
jgi:ferrous iron transport protein A